ncbi:MAG: Glu-tRNA(Gln) amidotransferase subunit GatD [archaeon]
MYTKEIEKILKEKKIALGDKIRITRGEEVHEGIIIPRPEKESSTIILKQDSGYNIGINYKNGAAIEKISPGKRLEIFPSIDIKSKEGLPKISMIATGGTISSRISYETGGVKWLMEPGQLLSIVPELEKIVDMQKIEKPFLIASENMSATHWQQLAEKTAELLNNGSAGVIITHGTDTLHYTAAALSFMLKNLSKPVVLTYSQKSTDRGSTDTVLNLTCAAYAAGHSDIAEVMLCGHGESSDTYCLLNRGTKVRKMHTSARHTFRPINDLPIAKIDSTGKIEILNDNYHKRTDKKTETDTKFEEKVALIKYYPGASPSLIDFLVKDGYKGIVIEATGLGHIATDESRYNWLPAIKNAISKGVVICAAAQTLYGRLDPLVYSEGRKVEDLGVIHLEDMLPETAYVKLGWVLGHTSDQKRAKEMMLENIAGELTEKTDVRTFLY